MELSHRRYTERDTGQILVTVPCELGMPDKGRDGGSDFYD